MTIPTFDSLFDAVEGMVQVVAKLVERDHLLDIHRDPQTGAMARFATCPAEPCVAWREFAARWDQLNGDRLP